LSVDDTKVNVPDSLTLSGKSSALFTWNGFSLVSKCSSVVVLSAFPSYSLVPRP
jgi:hypothetical protein